MSKATIMAKATVAETIDNAIRHSGKTQAEIAAEVGFPKPNVITMIKKGDTKLPIARLGAMARALDLDPVFLLRLTLQEYLPDTWEAVEEILGSPLLLTENEAKLIRRLRALSGGSDPRLSVAIDDKVSVVLGLPADAELIRKLLTA